MDMAVSEPEGRGAAWTEERGTSDEGRRRLKAPRRRAGDTAAADTGLQLRGIVAGYGQGDILRGLDLDVPAGQITCLIGPNGSGKSTVLRVISGLLRPRAGPVRLPR